MLVYTWHPWLRRCWKALAHGTRRQSKKARPVGTTLRVRELEKRLAPAAVTSVVSLLRSAPLGPTISATSVSYALTFNEAVTGVAAADFRLTESGSVQAATPVVVSGSGSAYTVAVNGIHGSGDLRLDLIDNDSIIGADGPLGGTGASNGSFQGQTYTILQADPYVVSINGTTPVSLTTNASSVSYTVTFSAAVTGVDAT